IKNGQVEIPVEYSYRDSNNNEYSEEETLVLNVHSAKELGKSSGGSGWAIFIAIIIIIVVYWQYRKWKKKKKRSS
ncbi:hypothetical protein KY308_00615, partial [Candidatus Woesearchaeota archaeon]|nr:hypothetical protein [Candidatus Woesearchaeota archaeon]